MMAREERSAGFLIYRPTNNGFEYLLLQASYPPHHWTPPKGHVDPGEDDWVAAIRETKEEAGINVDQLKIDKDFHYVQNYLVEGKPKTVAYWLAKLVVDQLKVKLSHEHQTMKWLNFEESIVLTKFKEMEDMLKAANAYLF